MKLKIFNLKALVLYSFMIVAHTGFAQQLDEDSSKDASIQMGKLREQMRDLQKQMNKLQTQEFRKKSKELQELSKKLHNQRLYYSYDNFANLNKNLGSINGLGSINIAPPTMPNLYIAPPADLHVPSVNFNYSDEKTLQKQIESGEVKEKTKTYSKTYSVDADDKLQINNTYGKVTINTWNKNEVKVDVQIKAYANDDDEAQNLLDNINIIDSKENSIVSFKTSIDRLNTSNTTTVIGTWFSSGKSHTRKVIINYLVYMPAKSQLDITNRFGSVILPDLSGKVNLNLSNGNLISQELTNPENLIKVNFGDAKITALSSGNITVNYGKLDVGTADKLKARVSFSSMNIDHLKSYGDIAVRYGEGIRVIELDKNMRNLNVDAQFTKVALGLKNNCDFNVTTRLGSFDYDNNIVKLISTSPDNNRHPAATHTFKGQVGKGDSEKVINITSHYTSVKFD